MKREWPASYRRLDSVSSDPEPLEVWASTAVVDPLWDDFLRHTPCGQYQQSTLWAEFKAGEGWEFYRVIVTGAEGIAGGFQILWKRKGPVRIGYVSKGPVVAPETPARVLLLTRLLAHAARELGLTAMIVQAPDEQRVFAGAEASPGFIESNPLKVIDATYLIDVRPGMEALRRVMHRNVRQCVRKAKEQGVGVRAGTEADLPRFFGLMAATCVRQKTTPNPADIVGLTRLWRIFARTNDVELAFAEGPGGEITAGRMNLIFGDRVTQWKKGWNGQHPEWHANELLVDHALEWAHAHGYRLCDFSAINRRIAEGLLRGDKDPVGPHARDRFNVRLGGFPQLLPLPQVYLPNPLVRWGYRQLYLPRERKRERLLHAGASQPETT